MPNPWGTCPAVTPLVAEWWEWLGRVQPRPTPTACAEAVKGARVLDDWVRAGRAVPIPLLQEVEQAIGVHDLKVEDASGVRSKLIYWSKVYPNCVYPHTGDHL